MADRLLSVSSACVFLDAEGNAKTMTPSEMEVHNRHVPDAGEKLRRLGSISWRARRKGRNRAAKLENHSTNVNEPAGCIELRMHFQNPDNIPAGKLVDELGLKTAPWKSAGLGGAWKFYC